MYPGREKPFFLSIGSLKMTNCSNRKMRLSLARDKKPLSCSVTVKVVELQPVAQLLPQLLTAKTDTTTRHHSFAGVSGPVEAKLKTVRSCFPSRQSNSLHLPLITSLVPHYLHLVLTPFSPAAHPLFSVGDRQDDESIFRPQGAAQILAVAVGRKRGRLSLKFANLTLPFGGGPDAEFADRVQRLEPGELGAELPDACGGSDATEVDMLPSLPAAE
ncbi:hypothetical protein EYF80_032826 [Liparis tanakae]|uniref:Uncharacterized protein n=1 Tax=Liparis tanakae TaxID=230148 RepID=A0A4Z2GTF7_9TELE|nr:hypothetical protein EYF80_032826 [Liparis tanakae]